MQTIIRFFATYSSFFLFLVLQIICFYLIIQFNQEQRDIFVNSSNLISGKFYDRFDHFNRLFQMESWLDSAQQENARLRAQLESSRYQTSTQLDTYSISDSETRYTYIPAKVVKNSINLRNNLMTIDKGGKHGIEKGMGVIESTGVVGVVREVNEYFSLVNPLLNNKTSISVTIRDKNYPGSLVWDGYHPLRMGLEGIPKHVPVAEGDEVITSGFSLFPRGLKVGKVSSVAIKPGSNSQDIQVTLYNDPGATYMVMVVNDQLHTFQDTLQTPILNEQ